MQAHKEFADMKRDKAIETMLDKVDLLYFQHYFGRGMHMLIRRSDDDPRWGVYKRTPLSSLDLPVIKEKFETASEAWDALKAMEHTSDTLQQKKAAK